MARTWWHRGGARLPWHRLGLQVSGVPKVAMVAMEELEEALEELEVAMGALEVAMEVLEGALWVLEVAMGVLEVALVALEVASVALEVASVEVEEQGWVGSQAPGAMVAVPQVVLVVRVDMEEVERAIMGLTARASWVEEGWTSSWSY